MYDIWRSRILDLYGLARPFIFRLDPEVAHEWTIKALQRNWGPRTLIADDPILQTQLWGKDFSNPIGLAAGMDKQAEVIDPLLRFGFGFAEIGGVTPRPQAGNAKPRVFRIPEAQAIINRYGFNSVGVEIFAERLHNWRDNPQRIIRPVGVNLGKNKETTNDAADYIACLRAVGANSDFVTVNVSSPNTSGLRDLQGRERLQNIVQQVLAVRDEIALKLPVLVKIAPDLTTEQQEDIAAVALGNAIQGLIISNTTIHRASNIPFDIAQETGGLSGRPLFGASTRLLGAMYKLTEGKIPLIGVGGVSSGADAYEKICAGASLVQLYSALVFHGPAVVGKIKQELAALLRQNRFTSIAEAVGSAQR